eukprot:767728-Hanusia_phi.AAC.2
MSRRPRGTMVWRWCCCPTGAISSSLLASSSQHLLSPLLAPCSQGTCGVSGSQGEVSFLLPHRPPVT